jgi:hypothetical protein
MSEEAKSIIDPKYRGQIAADWLTAFIDGQVREPVMKTVKVKDEDGKVTGEEQVPSAKSTVNLDKLFALSEANGVDTVKMRDQMDRPNAPGRIRMTLGNSLRAAAKRRHGLYNIDGDWTAAPADFLGDAPLKENPDGSKIAAAAE